MRGIKMNEIEKLMQNAEVTPICLIPDRYCGMQPIYEDFTAEKQIKLMKWLAKYKYSYGLEYLSDKWTNCCEYLLGSFEYVSEDTDFEQSLAGLVNIIWQSLTEQEKTRIKNILEM